MGSERPCRDCVSTEQDMLPAGRNCRNLGWEGNLVSWRPAEASPTCHWLPSLATAWDGSVPAGWFFWGYFADWRDRLCRGATLCEEAELPVDTSPQKVDRSPQKKEEMDFFFEGSGPKIKPRNFRAVSIFGICGRFPSKLRHCLPANLGSPPLDIAGAGASVSLPPNLGSPLSEKSSGGGCSVGSKASSPSVLPGLPHLNRYWYSREPGFRKASGKPGVWERKGLIYSGVEARLQKLAPGEDLPAVQ